MLMKNHSQVTSELLTITPAMAKNWIVKNTKNRNVSTREVDKIARSMSTHDWNITGEAVKFDWDGTLIDGQHRLLACIKANTPFQAVVVRGLDPASQFHMDQGKKRTAADALTLSGYANTGLLAATAAIIIREKNSFSIQSSNSNLSHGEIANVISRHPKLSDSVRKCCNMKCMPGAIATYVHYVATNFLDRGADADAFIRVFLDGYPNYDGCAAHKIRERFMRDGTRLTRNEKRDAAVHAWNLFKKGQKLMIAKWPERPEIIGLNLDLL